MSTDTKRLADARTKITRLTAERAAVEAAPRSREELRAFWAGKLQFDAATRSRGIVHALAQTGSGAPFSLLTPATGQPVDMTGLLAAVLGPQAMLAALEPFFELLPEGMTHEQRRQRLAELDAELSRAGHAEQDALDALEQAGQRVDYRPDADPAIVLRVSAP